MLALNKFTDVFDYIQPYRQKELLSLIMHKAILSPDSIKIVLYRRPPEKGLIKTASFKTLIPIHANIVLKKISLARSSNL